jgi:acetyl-CoA carboxylase carboxyltransferase component
MVLEIMHVWKSIRPKVNLRLAKCWISRYGRNKPQSIAQIEASSLKKAVKSSMKQKALFDKIKPDTTNRFRLIMLRRLWTDAIIDPLDTRTWISMGIEAANHSYWENLTWV